MNSRHLFIIIINQMYKSAYKHYMEQESLKAKQKQQREELLEKHRQNTGKYDRNIIEYALYKPNQNLDNWLKYLLIDAALENNDRALFLELTTELEGW